MSRQSSEHLWHEDARDNGWVMPRAAWWKRLPIVRNFRAAYHGVRAEIWASRLGSVGIGIGGVSQYDAWVLYGIATGKERPLRGKEPAP